MGKTGAYVELRVAPASGLRVDDSNATVGKQKPVPRMEGAVNQAPSTLQVPPGEGAQGFAKCTILPQRGRRVAQARLDRFECRVIERRSVGTERVSAGRRRCERRLEQQPVVQRLHADVGKLRILPAAGSKMKRSKEGAQGIRGVLAERTAPVEQSEIRSTPEILKQNHGPRLIAAQQPRHVRRNLPNPSDPAVEAEFGPRAVLRHGDRLVAPQPRQGLFQDRGAPTAAQLLPVRPASRCWTRHRGKCRS